MSAEPDLRFGRVPLPEPAPGFDPAGDALALFIPGAVSPAREPIPGRQVLDSLGPGQRFVVRVPGDWNGDLVACGTPATRSEFANDANLGDFLLARGYAFACANKAIPYNAVAEPAAETPDPGGAYPFPFERHGLRARAHVARFGALWPARIPPLRWHEDFRDSILAAKDVVRTLTGKAPLRTYAVGLSMGGGQVRWLLERHPELADGGLEWAAVHWSPSDLILDQLPPFLAAMPAYVRSGYADESAHAAIVGAGFPPDRRQPGSSHPSLWDDYYSNTPPFYADVTTFAFARVLDPGVPSWSGRAPNVRNPIDGAREAGPSDARGLALPEERARYRPSAAARATVAAFAHTGALERPLIGVAGDADAFVTPQRNFAPYLAAVRAAGRAHLYRQYLVAGGTHVDAFCAYGYGLQPQLPFVWAAFAQLEGIVRDGDAPAGAGTVRTVGVPEEIG
jgi:hypothetical protein